MRNSTIVLLIILAFVAMLYLKKKEAFHPVKYDPDDCDKIERNKSKCPDWVKWDLQTDLYPYVNPDWYPHDTYNKVSHDEQDFLKSNDERSDMNAHRASNSTDVQGYYWNPRWLGKRHDDCYKLDERGCMKYSNCGLCVKDGKKQCVPGDEHGPFFKANCDAWMHTNVYDRHIFKEKVTTYYPPWSHFYPDYEIFYPSPQTRATL